MYKILKEIKAHPRGNANSLTVVCPKTYNNTKKHGSTNDATGSIAVAGTYEVPDSELLTKYDDKSVLPECPTLKL